jgi:hypothetical protein
MSGKAPPTSRPAVWAAAVLAVYVLCVLLRRLAAFPALHVDEGWTGLFAVRIMKEGLITPHEMNDYTGPLYPWMLSKVFAALRPSILTLRLPGALCNAAALLAMAVHLGRRFGSRSSLAWLVLFSSSAMFALKSRLAWEVYALQPLLMVVIYASCRRFLERGDRSFLNAAVFLAANLVGVQNHFIFISVPLSLVAASAAALLSRKDPDARSLAVLALADLAMTTVFFLAKRPMTPAFWLAHREALVALFFGAPLIFAGLFRLLDGWCARHAERVFEAPGLARPWPSRALGWAMGAGLALFFVFHWAALIEIWSGVAVFKRLASWAPPLPAELALYAWAALLLGLLFWAMLTCWQPSEYRRLEPYERLVTLWPLAYACVFPLFRNTNSIRYYILGSWMFMAALAVLLPRLAAVRRARLLAPLACGVLALNALIWRESGPKVERRPFAFRVGWHRENSYHFAGKDALYRLADAERPCSVSQEEPSLWLPLEFYMTTLPGACRPGRTLRPVYDVGADRPPYVRGELR